MIFFVLLLLLHCARESFCLEKRITVNVDPSTEDCFYQPLKASDKLQIEYQVIGGGHGDLDISFNLAEPMGRIVVADFKKAEKIHNIEVEKSGDYKFCFDNTFSSFNTKTVYFEISVYSYLDEKSDSLDIHFDNSNTHIDIQKIESFYEVIDTVKNYLHKARGLQELIKLTEAKGRNISEETFFRVNTYSMFVLIIMILVSFIQILMVKSIFDDKSKIYQVLCLLDVSRK